MSDATRNAQASPPEEVPAPTVDPVSFTKYGYGHRHFFAVHYSKPGESPARRICLDRYTFEWGAELFQLIDLLLLSLLNHRTETVSFMIGMTDEEFIRDIQKVRLIMSDLLQ